MAPQPPAPFPPPIALTMLYQPPPPPQQPLPHPAVLPLPDQPAPTPKPPCWRWAFKPFDHNWPVHYLGRMDVACPNCGALHWIDEQSHRRSRFWHVLLERKN